MGVAVLTLGWGVATLVELVVVVGLLLVVAIVVVGNAIVGARVVEVAGSGVAVATKVVAGVVV